MLARRQRKNINMRSNARICILSVAILGSLTLLSINGLMQGVQAGETREQRIERIKAERAAEREHRERLKKAERLRKEAEAAERERQKYEKRAKMLERLERPARAVNKAGDAIIGGAARLPGPGKKTRKTLNYIYKGTTRAICRNNKCD